MPSWSPGSSPALSASASSSQPRSPSSSSACGSCFRGSGAGSGAPPFTTLRAEPRDDFVEALYDGVGPELLHRPSRIAVAHDDRGHAGGTRDRDVVHAVTDH